MNFVKTGILSLGLLVSASVFAEDHTVSAGVRDYNPLVIKVKPGDRVVWRNMTSHSTKSIDGMIPDGATPWESRLGEDGFNVTFDKPGAYVYLCPPHASFGMVGVIVVGDGVPANMDKLKVATDPMGKRAVKKLEAWMKEQGAQ